MTDAGRDRSPRPARARERGQGSESRGITTILNYVLLLVIVTIFVSGLFLGVSGFVEDQQQRAVGSQLETAGNRLAADVGTVERLARSTNESAGASVALSSQLPDTVGGSEYLVDVSSASGSGYTLTLRSVQPDVERSVVVRSSIGIQEGTVPGGRLVVRYDPSAGELVIDSA